MGGEWASSGHVFRVEPMRLTEDLDRREGMGERRDSKGPEHGGGWNCL